MLQSASIYLRVQYASCRRIAERFISDPVTTFFKGQKSSKDQYSPVASENLESGERERQNRNTSIAGDLAGDASSVANALGGNRKALYVACLWCILIVQVLIVVVIMNHFEVFGHRASWEDVKGHVSGHYERTKEKLKSITTTTTKSRKDYTDGSEGPNDTGVEKDSWKYFWSFIPIWMDDNDYYSKRHYLYLGSGDFSPGISLDPNGNIITPGSASSPGPSDSDDTPDFSTAASTVAVVSAIIGSYGDYDIVDELDEDGEDASGRPPPEGAPRDGLDDYIPGEDDACCLEWEDDGLKEERKARKKKKLSGDEDESDPDEFLEPNETSGKIGDANGDGKEDGVGGVGESGQIMGKDGEKKTEDQSSGESGMSKDAVEKESDSGAAEKKDNMDSKGAIVSEEKLADDSASSKEKSKSDTGKAASDMAEEEDDDLGLHNVLTDAFHFNDMPVYFRSCF